MKILAQLIRRQLRLKANKWGHCAVYEKELQRVWPTTEENRKAKIAQFAEQHGFRLAYYKQGLCAIFVEDSTGHDFRTSENRRAAEQRSESAAGRRDKTALL
jgi:hypothetical protein